MDGTTVEGGVCVCVELMEFERQILRSTLKDH
jgi:hypothetical protein